MRISDWSSDVCSSDLLAIGARGVAHHALVLAELVVEEQGVVPGKFRPAGSLSGGPIRRRGQGRVHLLLHESIMSWPYIRRRTWKTGRGAGRESGGQYVEIAVVAGEFKKKKKKN